MVAQHHRGDDEGGEGHEEAEGVEQSTQGHQVLLQAGLECSQPD